MALTNLPPQLPPFKPLPPSLNVIPFVFEGQWTILEQLAHLRAYIKWLIECVQEFEKWAGETSTDLENLHTTVNQIINNLTELDNRITALEGGSDADYEERISNLEEEVKNIKEELQNLVSGSSEGSITQIVNEALKNYVKRTGDTVTGDINFKNAAALFTGNNVDNPSYEVANVNGKWELYDRTNGKALFDISSGADNEFSFYNAIVGESDNPIRNIFANLITFADGSTMSTAPSDNSGDYVEKTGSTMTGQLVHTNSKGDEYKLSDSSNSYIVRRVNGVGFCITFKDVNGEEENWLLGVALNGKTINISPNTADKTFEAVLGSSRQIFKNVYTEQITFGDGTTMTTASSGAVDIENVSITIRNNNCTLTIYSVNGNIISVQLRNNNFADVIPDSSIYSAHLNKTYSNWRSRRIWEFGTTASPPIQTLSLVRSVYASIFPSSEGGSAFNINFSYATTDGSTSANVTLISGVNYNL